MKINLGSKNPVKIEALKETIKNYKFLSDAKMENFDITPSIGKQPKTLNETVEGAINRAKKSFQNCDYGVGIEDGLISVPQTKTGYINTTFCAIFDGEEIHLGMASGFEMPKKATQLVFKENIDMAKALYKTGITNNEKENYKKGVIYNLTKRRLSRKDRTKQAIQMALIHLENQELYSE